ncbi:MAG: NCS2 family permease, partial [Clostridia bacterium]|nr:NCS2 family permease [Clostridia bacterium]
VLYYLLGFTVPGFYDGFMSGVSLNSIDAFQEFFAHSFGKVFTEGFDFSAYLAKDGNNVGSLVIGLITTALAFCMVDMFDTMGTLYGACRGGNLLIKNEKGEEEVPNVNRAMLADAIATCTGAVCGTSTVTTYVEAASGVGAGGRTGLSAMVTAAMFFVAMFLSPIVSLIPACAYAAALIYVGILMIGCVKEIDWSDPAIALPAFFTIVMMPFTFSISYGIAFGLIAHIAIKACTGKIKEIRIGTWIIALLFTLMFFLTH